MKYSQFNTIIPFDDQFALFNSLSQKVMFIEPQLRELLLAAINEGIENLKEYHPSFYDYLVNEEYVIESGVDEVEKVKSLRNSVDYNSDNFFLTINPTMNCNFKCWYCYETHIKKSKFDDEMINKINKFIENRMNDVNLKSFNLSFFGGEPLLYFKKDVVPIIDFYLAKCLEKNIVPTVSFTSNGYLVNQEFVDYFDSKGIKPALQITLDGYKEKHDLVRFVSANKGSYDKIVENIRLLISNKIFVNLRINYTSENIEDTHKISEEFSDLPQELVSRYLEFDFHRVWQDDKLDNTDVVVSENLEIIQDRGIIAKSGYTADNVRNSCYADKINSAVINYNGDLYKCTARDFNQTNKEGYLSDGGELIWENNNLEKRMDAKFKNKPCLSCKIMPLCNGGCSQHALDHVGEDYCVYFGDENEKDKVVKTKIIDILSVAEQEV